MAQRTHYMQPFYLGIAVFSTLGILSIIFNIRLDLLLMVVGFMFLIQGGKE